jgi:hypothetical protein
MLANTLVDVFPQVDSIASGAVIVTAVIFAHRMLRKTYHETTESFEKEATRQTARVAVLEEDMRMERGMRFEAEKQAKEALAEQARLLSILARHGISPDE